MDENNYIVEDSEDFRKGGGNSFKEVCLEQVRRTVLIGSREHREGFMVYDNKPHTSSQPVRYIGDSRKEYLNCVNVLHDLLMPKFDKEAKTNVEEIYEAIAKQRKIDAEKFKGVQDKYQREKIIDKNWEHKLEQYRYLFQELCLFLERLGWLDTEGIED